VMVGSKKTLPTLQGMVLSLNVTNKTVRDNYLIQLINLQKRLHSNSLKIKHLTNRYNQ
jgi:hypothetical protein